MPAQVILVEAQPARAADGIAETIRLAGGGALMPYTYSGQTDWRAGVVGLPTLIASLEYEGGEFPAGSVPAAAAIEWAPSNKALLSATASYVWADAPVTVRIGSEGAALPPVRISGKVLDAKASGGKLTIALADPATGLKKPLLTARFAGTGGLEGPAEWDGQIRRRVWGRVWNLSGDPLDAANNIYCYADPLRPLQAFDAVRDKGAPAAALTVLAWQGSAAATFAALQAASAPAGGGVVCPSIACVKWWTQPAGELCADLRGEVGGGYVETTAGIAQRLVEAIGGPAFTAGTVAAASAARPAPVGWVAKDDTSTVAAMLDELLGNSSLLWLLDDNGAITIRTWTWGASVASAASQDVSREQVLRPLATRKLGYKRNETPMQRGDLAAIVLSSEVAYLDGTSIEALKPAQPGATAGATVGGNLRLTDGNIPNQAQVITAEGTAAAIAGQGYFATQNFADWATRISGLGKPQDNATWGAISGVNLRNNADTAYLGDLDIITAAGTAAAITGQGPGATAVAGAVMNYAVGLGQNVLTNSAFENGSYGWEPGWDNYASFTPEHGVGLPGYSGALSTAYTRVLGTPPAGVFDSYTPSGGNPKRWWLPVSSGDRVFASALVAYHRLAYAPDLNVGWYDASGVYLTESVVATGGRNGGAVNGEPANFDRVGGFLLAPANARYARIWIRGATDGGQTDPYLFYTQMMLCRVPADQTAWPVYHDGGADLFANVTGENTAAAIAGQGPLATAPSASPYVNANITIGANGALSGAGGGSVTIGGLGYLGDLDATRGARVGLNLRNSADTAYLGDADVVTASGIAAGFSGQGALATKSAVNLASAEVTNKSLANLDGTANTKLTGIETGATVGGVFGTNLRETAGGTVATLAAFKTASGTAAAVAGQSAWATYSGLVPSNVAGQVQHLQTDGNIQSLHVYKPGVALLNDVWPGEAGANVTESRTAAAINGQGYFATQNYAGVSRLLTAGYDNIIPDGDYRDPVWWGFSGLPNVGFLEMDSYWEQRRSLSFTCDRDFDFSSAYFNIEPGSVYRVRTRIWNNDAGAGWTGNFWALIHMPNVAWWSLKHGAAVNADVGGSANAIAAIGDTGVQEFYFRATSNTMRNIQFRFKSTARGSRVDLQVMISKVPQLGKDLIKSGTTTKYLVSEIETGLGTAAAIAGQGAGATANNLAQLDATAAAQLTTAYNGGVQSAAYGETIKRKIGAGGTLALSALVNCAAGGVSGSIRARIDSRPFGGSWSTVATGAGSSTGPGEPGGDSTSGTFTNSTGVEQVFEFRVIEARTPSGAGGAILASQSYVTG